MNMKGIMEHYIVNHEENPKNIKKLENLVRYAMKENLLGDRLAYFISDVFPEMSFGEVAIYINDKELSRHGQLEKYKALFDIRRGYKCWLVFYMGYNIIEISDDEIKKILSTRKPLTISRLAYSSEACVNALYEDMKKDFKEHPDDKNIKRLLDTKAFWKALEIKLMSAFCLFYKTKG